MNSFHEKIFIFFFQIVVSILQGVSAQFPCRWDEILEFRRSHIGSAEQASRTLLYQKNQLQYLQTGYPGAYYPPGGAPPHPVSGAPPMNPYGQFSPYSSMAYPPGVIPNAVHPMSSKPVGKFEKCRENEAVYKLNQFDGIFSPFYSSNCKTRRFVKSSSSSKWPQ